MTLKADFQYSHPPSMENRYELTTEIDSGVGSEEGE